MSPLTPRDPEGQLTPMARPGAAGRPRERRRGMLARAAPLLLLAVLAGCDSSSPSAGNRSSDFAAGARRACAAYYGRAYALPPPTGIAQLTAYPEKQQALREQEYASLRALTAPTAERAAYARYLSNMAVLDDLYAKWIAHPSGTPAAVQSFGESITRLHSTLVTEARALGLTQCAEDPYSATHYSKS